jgi:hypothetical protein
MERKRAIYIGEDCPVEVWANHRRSNYILHYGMTGDYIGDTFIPDDKACPSVTLKRRNFYFPSL